MATANLMHDASPLGLAMREAFAVVLGTAPHAPVRGELWPHPDRAVRDRFHAHWTARAQALTGLDPNKGLPDAERGPAPAVAPVVDIPRTVGGRGHSNDALRALIAELDAQGLSTFAIARHVGRTGSTVRYHLTLLHGEARAVRIRALHAEGLSGPAIAERVGVSSQRVTQVLQRAGITRPIHDIGAWIAKKARRDAA